MSGGNASALHAAGVQPSASPLPTTPLGSGAGSTVPSVDGTSLNLQLSPVASPRAVDTATAAATTSTTAEEAVPVVASPAATPSATVAPVSPALPIPAAAVPSGDTDAHGHGDADDAGSDGHSEGGEHDDVDFDSLLPDGVDIDMPMTGGSASSSSAAAAAARPALSSAAASNGFGSTAAGEVGGSSGDAQSSQTASEPSTSPGAAARAQDKSRITMALRTAFAAMDTPASAASATAPTATAPASVDEVPTQASGGAGAADSGVHDRVQAALRTANAGILLWQSPEPSKGARFSFPANGDDSESKGKSLE